MKSPLEQFYILPFFDLEIFYFIGLNNLVLTSIFILSFLIFYFFSVINKTNKTLFIKTNCWQYISEFIFSSVLLILKENIHSKIRSKIFPFVLTIFLYILFLNLFGIIPFAFTITSLFIVCLSISGVVFLGIQLIGIKKHGLQLFSLFIPSGISVELSLLLIPIEFISFIFKPISLSVRLFANMVAGHILLKVVAGFIWSIMSLIGFSSLSHLIIILLFIILVGLEIFVAFIQAFVFTTLICIYINETLYLH